MTQGIYAGPCDIVPNKNREPISDLKMWIIEFEVFVTPSLMKTGCAVVKAGNVNSAIQILLKDGLYNGTPNRYHVTRVTEIVPSPSSMLICEQINNSEYEC